MINIINKISKKIAIVFFIIYSLCVTFGSIYLITFGERTIFKSTLGFFLNFPFDWNIIIMKNIFIGIILNIIFWTIIVYFLSIGAIKFVGYVKRIG